MAATFSKAWEASSFADGYARPSASPDLLLSPQLGETERRLSGGLSNGDVTYVDNSMIIQVERLAEVTFSDHNGKGSSFP